MKHAAGKSWPWPVLRRDSDDYRRCEFQVEVNLDKIPDSTRIMITADFVLSDADLLRLVKGGNAEFALLTSCPTTHFRQHRFTSSALYRWEIPNGQLRGEVEVSPYLVAKTRIPGFRAANWHPDYAGRTYNLEAGSVLAVDDTWKYWIENADEQRISSVFRIAKDESGELNPGEWICRANEDGRVDITLHANQYDHFNAARAHPSSDTRDNILNAVYLPALYWLLNYADAGVVDDDQDQLWWNAVSAALERAGCKPLGDDDSADRLLDAQKLLQLPFAKLPLLREAGR